MAVLFTSDMFYVKVQLDPTGDVKVSHHGKNPELSRACTAVKIWPESCFPKSHQINIYDRAFQNPTIENPKALENHEYFYTMKTTFSLHF